MATMLSPKLFLSRISFALIFWQRLAYADISQTRVALQLLHISRQQFKGLYIFLGEMYVRLHTLCDYFYRSKIKLARSSYCFLCELLISR